MAILLSALRASLVSHFASLRSSIKDELAMVGSALKSIFGALAGAVAAFAGATVAATRATLDYARSIALIRANTGLGLSQSARVAGSFGAFGISARDVAGMLSGPLMNPTLFRQRANMYGLPGYENRDFLSRTASRYQSDRNSGPYGQLRADAMLKSLGLDNDDIRLIVNLPPEKIKAQQQFQNRVSSQFGLSPDVLQKYAEDVPLALNRIGSLIQAFVQRLATAALPLLERALGILQNLLARLLPIFQTIIGDITSYLEANAGGIEDALFNAIQWVYKTMPVLILDGLIWLVAGVGKVLDVLGSHIGGLGKLIPPILAFFDIIINTVKSVLDMLLKVVRRSLPYIIATALDPSIATTVKSLHAWAKTPSDLSAEGPGYEASIADFGKRVSDYGKSGPIADALGTLTGVRDDYTKYMKSVDDRAGRIASATEEIAVNSRKIERLRDIASTLNNYVAESGYNAAFT